jgi:hypothetical protein
LSICLENESPDRILIIVPKFEKLTINKTRRKIEYTPKFGSNSWKKFNVVPINGLIKINFDSRSPV